MKKVLAMKVWLLEDVALYNMPYILGDTILPLCL
jgi:hypothetical protein